jgi:UDP-N-acetylmuramoyl-L-alanyl-D-glutamate--2,6-diaminopimelate ligase
MITYLKKIIPLKLFKKLQPIYHFILAWLAALWYGFPGNKLIVIGVTGTTGKTSVVYLIVRALEEAGWPTGYSSTAQFSDGKREWLNDRKMTMPGRFFLQKLLRKMLKNNCRFAVIETTSQGIEQFRHRFINYDTVVVTGLYPEHIEAHGSFDNYKRAKGKLCEHLKRFPQKYINDGKQIIKPKGKLDKLDLNRVKKTLIVNNNDEHSSYFLSFKADNKITLIKNDELKNDLMQEYKNLDFYTLTQVKTDNTGTSFSLNDNSFDLKLFGDFQAENASLAAIVAYSYQAQYDQVKEALEKISALAGKMEKINIGQDFQVIIDYAFEPVALEKLYKLLEVFEYKRIIHVLGSAGGGRDEARRPKLGKIAGSKADIVIVTNEDPYDEDPQLIIDQVASGADLVGKKENDNLFKILDRRKAISFALKKAEKDDLVLITGKGAEQFICLANNHKISWDDRKVARQELEKNCG